MTPTLYCRLLACVLACLLATYLTHLHGSHTATHTLPPTPSRASFPPPLSLPLSLSLSLPPSPSLTLSLSPSPLILSPLTPGLFQPPFPGPTGSRVNVTGQKVGLTRSNQIGG
ncbi:hypothetical protein GGR50DRAFT_255530 [Xylaria sp. CBS 124048]|nr:hypothetical protein GGR50DRAFT_255530 [Xylaria sp. CBS 124048]